MDAKGWQHPGVVTPESSALLRKHGMKTDQPVRTVKSISGNLVMKDTAGPRSGSPELDTVIRTQRGRGSEGTMSDGVLRPGAGKQWILPITPGT